MNEDEMDELELLEVCKNHLGKRIANLEVSCKSAQAAKETAVAKTAELSAQLELVSSKLDSKKWEIAIYVKKHAKIQQVEAEIVAIKETNATLQIEIEKGKIFLEFQCSLFAFKSLLN
jgi:hypothetical protein